MNDSVNISGLRKLPLIIQAETAECGLACVAMIAGYYGYNVDIAAMRRRFPLSLNGTTLRTLLDIIGSVGLNGRAVRCELEDITNIRTPAILHWGVSHFVVLKSATSRHIIIHDPAHGRLKLPLSEVSDKFTGVAVELVPSGTFQRVRERNPLRLDSVITFNPGTIKAFFQAITLSLIVEATLLASPFYLQFVIDDALLKSDAGVLTALFVSFSLLLSFRVISVALRGLTTQFISSVISFDAKSRIFNHLLRLPLDWFQKRQIGDVQSRFWSLRSIQNFISQGALTGLLDGVLGTAVLVFMFLYSPRLVLVVLGSVLTYALIRIATYQISRRYAADAITTDAREQTRLLETLRAAQTIKAAGLEGVRDLHYRNAAAATINSQIRAGNVRIGSVAAEQALSGFTDLLVVYIGAKNVISGDFTIGMLTAFLAYKHQFVSRFTNMLEQVFSWRMLDLHLERLSDIVLTPKEERVDYGGHEGYVSGDIECRSLSFRYAFGEAPVLNGLSIKIASGECVAIAGASGCGKSTLAKLLIGLYSPSGGEVLIDGRPLQYWSNRSLRTQISYVSQDDQLLAGTIAENIAFFAEHIDMHHVRECARTACVIDDIMSMPMAFESLVGDMGSTLSGGQKQRVIIARALYRRPRILVFDEATAHLDVITEASVIASLASLTITRVIIAHRPETIAAADRVITVDHGKNAAHLLNVIERLRSSNQVMP